MIFNTHRASEIIRNIIRSKYYLTVTSEQSNAITGNQLSQVKECSNMFGQTWDRHFRGPDTCAKTFWGQSCPLVKI